MFIVGLTGGIGSGKSTVSRRFELHGIPIVDADVIARDILKPGSACLDKVTAHFGQHILDDNGELNRRKLRDIVFADKLEKAWLESVTHPEIRNIIERELTSSASPYTILSSPILLETTLHQLVHRIVVVDMEESLQVTRASSRDNATEADIKKIMATQISREQRLRRADDIIDNSGSIENSQKQVDDLHHKYLQFALV